MKKSSLKKLILSGLVAGTVLSSVVPAYATEYTLTKSIEYKNDPDDAVVQDFADQAKNDGIALDTATSAFVVYGNTDMTFKSINLTKGTITIAGNLAGTTPSDGTVTVTNEIHPTVGGKTALNILARGITLTAGVHAEAQSTGEAEYTFKTGDGGFSVNDTTLKVTSATGKDASIAINSDGDVDLGAVTVTDGAASTDAKLTVSAGTQKTIGDVTAKGIDAIGTAGDGATVDITSSGTKAQSFTSTKALQTTAKDANATITIKTEGDIKIADGAGAGYAVKATIATGAAAAKESKIILSGANVTADEAVSATGLTNDLGKTEVDITATTGAITVKAVEATAAKSNSTVKLDAETTVTTSAITAKALTKAADVGTATVTVIAGDDVTVKGDLTAGADDSKGKSIVTITTPGNVIINDGTDDKSIVADNTAGTGATVQIANSKDDLATKEKLASKYAAESIKAKDIAITATTANAGVILAAESVALSAASDTVQLAGTSSGKEATLTVFANEASLGAIKFAGTDYNTITAKGLSDISTDTTLTVKKITVGNTGNDNAITVAGNIKSNAAGTDFFNMTAAGKVTVTATKAITIDNESPIEIKNGNVVLNANQLTVGDLTVGTGATNNPTLTIEGKTPKGGNAPIITTGVLKAYGAAAANTSITITTDTKKTGTVDVESIDAATGSVAIGATGTQFDTVTIGDEGIASKSTGSTVDVYAVTVNSSGDIKTTGDTVTIKADSAIDVGDIESQATNKKVALTANTSGDKSVKTGAIKADAATKATVEITTGTATIGADDDGVSITSGSSATKIGEVTITASTVGIEGDITTEGNNSFVKVGSTTADTGTVKLGGDLISKGDATNASTIKIGEGKNFETIDGGVNEIQVGEINKIGAHV